MGANTFSFPLGLHYMRKGDDVEVRKLEKHFAVLVPDTSLKEDSMLCVAMTLDEETAEAVATFHREKITNATPAAGAR
jgi:hypothetical protein